MEITIKKLTPELIDSYFYFFDHVAFTDNPRWASCYCNFYSQSWSEGEWEQRTGEENRQSSRQRIEAGLLNGYLAFANDQPVGWCHANDKANLGALANFPPQTDGQEASSSGRTGCIICYIVAPEARGQGVATQLLAAACEGFVEQGFARIEAYPPKHGVTAQDNYHGTLGMYLKQGFVESGEIESMIVVRKELR